jgi:hypothetical protein
MDWFCPFGKCPYAKGIIFTNALALAAHLIEVHELSRQFVEQALQPSAG